MEYGEALVFAQSGKTAQELMAMGIPRATAYRVVRMVRFGVLTSSRTTGSGNGSEGEDSKPETATAPPVQRKSIVSLPRDKIPANMLEKYLTQTGTLVVQPDEGLDAEQIAITTRVQRIPVPLLLNAAYVAARREWKWPPMNMRDFIDTCLFHLFLLSDDIVLGGQYYRLEEAQEISAALEEVTNASPGCANTTSEKDAAPVNDSGGEQVPTEASPHG